MVHHDYWYERFARVVLTLLRASVFFTAFVGVPAQAETTDTHASTSTLHTEQPQRAVFDTTLTQIDAEIDHRVQLFASLHRDRVLEVWTTLSFMRPELFRDLTPVMAQKASVAGQIYTLQVGSFSNEPSARAFCRSVSAEGIDCFLAN